MSGAFDIERYRHKHESKREWELRSAFILAHHEKLPMDRLSCLASCFINSVCYGCRYPALVMAELEELSDDIKPLLDGYRNGKRKTKEVAFVKASKNDHEPSKKVKKTGTINFVKSHEKYTSSATSNSNATVCKNFDARNEVLAPIGARVAKQKTNEAQNEFVASHPLDRTFADLRDAINAFRTNPNLHNNAVAILHSAADKINSPRLEIVPEYVEFINATDRFCCSVTINTVLIASGEGPTKKVSKHNAFNNCMTLLTKPYLHVEISASGHLSLHGSDTPPSTIQTSAACPSVKQTHSLSKPQQESPHQQQINLPHFLLIEHTMTTAGSSAQNMLQQSADFNKVLLTYDFRTPSVVGGCMYCDVFLDEQKIAEGSGATKADAKKQSAEKAISQLRNTQWTISVKKHEDTDKLGITRDNVVGKEGENEAIADSNVGNRLLKMMGWQGGGIGKHGDGISEPVCSAGVINRSGLGLHSSDNVGHNFHAKIKEVLSDYATSNTGEDIAFANDFSKEERAIIHVECRKLGLKSHSHGKGNERYIVVSCKRTAAELFEHLLENDGNTSKYSLVAPKNVQ